MLLLSRDRTINSISHCVSEVTVQNTILKVDKILFQTGTLNYRTYSNKTHAELNNLSGHAFNCDCMYAVVDVCSHRYYITHPLGNIVSMMR